MSSFRGVISRSHMDSPYMQYAKLHSSAKYNLATSAVMPYPLSELPIRIEDLEINGLNAYGFGPLIARIARYNDVPPECVVTAPGTSMANHLAMAATFDPGDEVLIEYPTYELLVSTARFLGATVRYFERRMEDGFAIHPEAVEREMTPGTRLIILTNLHNPSGALTSNTTLQEIGEIAKTRSAFVLVDEVYLEALYGKRPPNAFHLGEQFIVTSSLTKAFGMSGIRCGWVLAAPGLAKRMWLINDLYGATPAHPAELIGVAAFDNLATITTRASELLSANWSAWNQCFDGSDDLIAWHKPEAGTVVFPLLKQADPDTFFDLLRVDYETTVVPGKYFDLPRHFRIGLGGDPHTTSAGLKQLRSALEKYRRDQL